MALSRIVHIGDGTTRQFAIPFALGYISQDDISCRVGEEVDGLGEPVYRDLTFLSEELVEISGTAPAAGIRVLFDRTTPKDNLIVDFEDDAVLNEENLNTAQRQALMVAHEALDGRIAQLQADIDANNYQIINLRTPTAPNEAATKAYVDSTLPASVQLAQEAAVEAVNAAGAAVAAAGQSAGFASAAGNAANAAQQAVTNAAAQVTLAEAQVALAVQAVSDAAAQVSLANAARTGAEAAEVSARRWAEKMDGPVIGDVEGENQSARWWANKAENEVQQAIEDALAELPAFTGTNGTAAGLQGLVPAPLAADLGKFLAADGTWKALPNTGVQRVTTKAAVAAIVGPTSGQVLLLDDPNFGGLFVFDSTNNTANVTNDPQQGFYIAPAAATTGASGVWKRVDQTKIDIRFFGATQLTLATAATGADSGPAIQAAINFARYKLRHVVSIPDGIFRVNTQIELLRGTALHGPGRTIGVRWDAGIRDADQGGNTGVTGWDYQGGAILAITHNVATGVVGDEASSTILMGTGTGIKGLGFWWPLQPMSGTATPIQYPYAIGNKPNPMEARKTLEGEYLVDLHCTNAWNFVSWMNPQGPCSIDHVYGFSIKQGFRFDNAFDILRVQDVHWNPVLVNVGFWGATNIQTLQIAAEGVFMTLYKADQAYFKFVFCWGPFHGLIMSNSPGQDGGPARSANGTRFVSCGFEGGQNALEILGDAHGTTFYSLILGSSDINGTGDLLRGYRTVTVNPPNNVRKLIFYDLTIFDALDQYCAFNKVDNLRIEEGVWEGARRIYPSLSEKCIVLNNCTNFSIKGVTIRRGTNLVGLEANGCRGGIVWGNFFENSIDQRCLSFNSCKAVRIGWNFNMSPNVGTAPNTSNHVWVGGGTDVAGDLVLIDAS